MSQEARINEALRALGEEYRLGMVQAGEYRARRRMLIDAWHEKEVTTAPGSLRKAGFSTIPPGARSAVRDEPPPPNTARLVLIGLGVAAAVAVSGYFTFKPRAAETAATPSAEPPPAPLSPRVLAARRAAEEFIAANAWEAEPIEALLAHWRQLTPEDRAQAREQPALRTLRFKLDQNIQAEAQLVAPEAPPEERQRLDLLTRFAEELDA